MKKTITGILAIFLITLFSCSEMAGEFEYMDELKNSISEKYETEKVEINIKNSNELIVTLTDQKFGDYSSAKKGRIALEIGKLAQELREGKKKIKTGGVNFRDEENYGIAKTSNSVTFQMYK